LLLLLLQFELTIEGWKRSNWAWIKTKIKSTILVLHLFQPKFGSNMDKPKSWV